MGVSYSKLLTDSIAAVLLGAVHKFPVDDLPPVAAVSLGAPFPTRVARSLVSIVLVALGAPGTTLDWEWEWGPKGLPVGGRVIVTLGLNSPDEVTVTKFNDALRLATTKVLLERQDLPLDVRWDSKSRSGGKIRKCHGEMAAALERLPPEDSPLREYKHANPKVPLSGFETSPYNLMIRLVDEVARVACEAVIARLATDPLYALYDRSNTATNTATKTVIDHIHANHLNHGVALHASRIAACVSAILKRKAAAQTQTAQQTFAAFRSIRCIAEIEITPRVVHSDDDDDDLNASICISFMKECEIDEGTRTPKELEDAAIEHLVDVLRAPLTREYVARSNVYVKGEIVVDPIAATIVAAIDSKTCRAIPERHDDTTV